MTKTIDEAAQARREYYKAWRAKNKDKVKQYNAAYWIRRAARAAEASAEEVSNE